MSYDKAYYKNWYEKNRERMLEKNRCWYQSNKEHAKEYSKQYRKSHPHVYRKSVREWVEKNPLKKMCQKYVRVALYHKIITRQPCEVCGTTENIHAHHTDYTKPLEIKWLCEKHHLQLHFSKSTECVS